MPGAVAGPLAALGIVRGTVSQGHRGEGLSMRRSIITTIVFVVGMTVYLLLLGHVVENQQAMQREECAQAAQIYADELEKDFNTSSSVTETLAYMIADTGTVPEHFADVAKEMMATRPYVASIQLAPQGRVTDIYPSDAAGGESEPLLPARPSGEPPLQPRHGHSDHAGPIQPGG